jgi:F-type H+-transporting ATPase subunit b
MDLLMPHSGTVLWMFIAFLTVFLILKKYAWKPILGALKQRENTISNALKSAEAAKEEMSRLQADNEKIIADAKSVRDQILKEARELKDQMISESKHRANEEANKIIEEAKNTIKNEKASAINEIKKQVADLSISIAEKILHEKLADDKEQKELIDKLVKGIKIN